MKERITAAEFKRMVISASATIENNKQKLNDLNVFPVPDGDTGTNMSLTAKAAATALVSSEPDTIAKATDITASALLRGARGNSGVILSLLFRGFAKACAGETDIDARAFAKALNSGVESAYRAVMKPAEGTILSVSRKAAERAMSVSRKESDVEVVFDEAIKAARVALDETTSINPVLAKAGVVDAGGCGWLLVLEAMYSSYLGNDVALLSGEEIKSSSAPTVAKVTDEEITFTYCTEFIINIAKDAKNTDPATLRAYLETIGDCVVVVDDDDIIKVHVHTNQPDRAIGRALTYGELTNLKIDNMRYQHEEGDAQPSAPEEEPKIAEPETKYGFAVVGAGEGILNAFRDLGANTVIEGGQTMNPSTEDILAAVNATPSEVVFVLPNNKNIIMAAQAAAELSPKQVVVLETKTIPQGISAMLAFDPDGEVADNAESMMAAAKNVSTGSITYAARDSDFDGHNIKEGEYLALCEGKLSASGPDINEVANQLVADMGISDKEFVTVFYGEGVSADDATVVEEICKNTATDAEVMVLDGGQPVYYYLISAE
ncbi:MAG: DAK2 domain-containing protein [Ruminococcaceae bacterium]|nr:DAK2 domain-containing protein [Oscillospiraceae bacterium]